MHQFLVQSEQKGSKYLCVVFQEVHECVCVL